MHVLPYYRAQEIKLPQDRSGEYVPIGPYNIFSCFHLYLCSPVFTAFICVRLVYLHPCVFYSVFVYVHAYVPLCSPVFFHVYAYCIYPRTYSIVCSPVSTCVHFCVHLCLSSVSIPPLLACVHYCSPGCIPVCSVVYNWVCSHIHTVEHSRCHEPVHL